jgi:hypothetical protein
LSLVIIVPPSLRFLLNHIAYMRIYQGFSAFSGFFTLPL